MTVSVQPQPRSGAGAPSVTARSAALHIEKLTKSFGELEVLRSIDLDVHAGEFLTLLGPSGSGKTTLLRIIAGFESATSGSLMLGDVDLGSLPPSERKLGMVFQNYALFPHLTVEQNIAYGLKLRKCRGPKLQARVNEMLEIVGLEKHSRRKPSQLSGGQQQRVALARALAYEPEILLMDEPLGALDRSLRLQMEEEIKRVHRQIGTTVVYVTHDQEEALVLSDRVAIMNEGQFAGLDTPMSLFHRPPNGFVARFFSDSNVLEAQAGDGIVHAYGQSFPHDSPIDGDVELAIRPRSFVIGNHPESGPGLRFTGELEEQHLLGEHVQLHISVPEIGRLVARRNIGDDGRLDVGDSLKLFVPASAVHVMSV
ncbi:ABC transporter ATP-binding protein [Arthrobacter sp. CAU 1506]|uniref:ABC transporter ATP-binding protein n=1 Tax=Arthrobacter sp. CAU 1506 TaxID=2560052 RepID=UPI0010AD460C|nr:ABC transporter ATP-binding protein [Arthrobacter sp. CAU 1506]TJY66172.1 ABC transporter ATP-binding protein [Arthrobacter sp. CAU 1506]